MLNCIASNALMDVCRTLGLLTYWIDGTAQAYSDICIVGEGQYGGSMNTVEAFKLSDYLLATAPIDINKDVTCPSSNSTPR